MDEKFQRLSKPQPNAQSLWFYLLFGPHTNSLPGLSNMGELSLSEALEWPLEAFRKCFKEIVDQGMAEADWTARVIWLPNAIKYNAPQSPNVITGWSESVKAIPACALKTKWLHRVRAFIEDMRDSKGNRMPAFSKAFREAFPEAYREAFPEGLPEAARAGTRARPRTRPAAETAAGAGTRAGTGMLMSTSAAASAGAADAAAGPKSGGDREAVISELKAARINDPKRTQLADNPDLTPMLVRFLRHEAQKSTLKNKSVFVIQELEADAGPRPIPPKEVARLANEHQIASIDGHAVTGKVGQRPDCVVIDVGGANVQVPAERLTTSTIVLNTNGHERNGK